jgi:hypothetical protein
VLDAIAPGLVERAALSEAKRLEFVDALQPTVEEFLKDSSICVYTTGSYGRREASIDETGRSRSDIDLFILDTAIDETGRIDGLTTIRLQAALIETADSLRFPPFDGDGKFLGVHWLNDMKEEIGSDTEDANNLFTARLLLLLESQPLVNAAEHQSALELLIGEYLRDADRHPDDFMPAFLLNDIARYWRTLCLNYEHRLRDSRGTPQGRLKNHKLGFSRMLTCYSGILQLASSFKLHATVSSTAVLETVLTSPIDRLVAIADRHDDLRLTVQLAIERYDWFLSTLCQNKSDALDCLGSESGHGEARAMQRDFHLALVEIYKHLLADTELERFALM